MKTKQQESITAGRRAEQEEALRVIGENAAEIIHELKAPLSNIMAYMQLIERRLQKAGVETQDLPFPVCLLYTSPHTPTDLFSSAGSTKSGK